MDKYYTSSHFNDILRRYEDIRNGAGGYLEADELTDVAEYYHLRGMRKESLEAADMAEEMFPDATAPLAFKARVAMLIDRDYERACKLLDKIRDKTDIDYIYTLAEVMVAAGKTEQADLMLLERLEEEDAYDEDRDNFILDVTNIYFDHEQYDYAGEWLDRVEDTSNDNFKELRAKVLMIKGKFEECERILNELIDKDPYSGVYWNDLAKSQLLSSNINASITSSEYAIAINPNDEEAVLNKANGLFSLGNFEKALEYFKHYSQLDPGSEIGDMFQGFCLSNLDKDIDAMEYLKNAEKKAKSNRAMLNLQQTYQEMSMVSSRLGDKDKALQYADKMIEAGAEPDLTNIIKGYIHLEYKEMDEALKDFANALRNTSSSPRVLFHIATAMYDNGYLNIAYKTFHIFLKKIPEDWNVGFSHFARCCFDLGKREEYEKALRKAVDTNPIEARLVLGDLYPEEASPEDYPYIEPVKSSH